MMNDVNQPMGRSALWIGRILLPGAFFGLWEWSSGRWLEAWMVSSPSQILLRLYEIFGSGEIWPHLQATLSSLVIGFPLGVISGVLVGYLLGSHRQLSLLLEPIIVGLHGIPKVVLAPLFILWLGIGIGSKVALVVLLSFFHNFFNTHTGLRQLDMDLVKYGRLLGAKGFMMTYGVVMPAISPHIMTGIRTSMPLAFIGVAVGEFVAARHGLGLFVREAVSLFDTTGALAGVAVFFILIVFTNSFLSRMESHFLRWLPKRERLVAISSSP
jgi:NitT/TauT family transport system permease protein